MSQSEYIYFADCVIDVAGFSLRRKGEVCELEPQVLELLLFLVRNPDRLITRTTPQRLARASSPTPPSPAISRHARLSATTARSKADPHAWPRVRFIAAVRTGCRRGERQDSGEMLVRANEAVADTTLKRNWPTVTVLPFTNLGGDDDQTISPTA
jgi:hypothetical protein